MPGTSAPTAPTGRQDQEATTNALASQQAENFATSAKPKNGRGTVGSNPSHPQSSYRVKKLLLPRVEKRSPVSHTRQKATRDSLDQKGQAVITTCLLRNKGTVKSL